MPMEIKIDAINIGDFARQVADIHNHLSSSHEAVPVVEADTMSLQDLIEITVKRAKAAGFNITIADPDTDAVLVAPAKKTRRQKISEAAEKDPPLELSEEKEADAPTEIEYSADGEDLKSDVIAKCSQLMLDGRRDVVMTLKKEFGRTLSDLPADKFPAIAKRLEEILEDGPSDE